MPEHLKTARALRVYEYVDQDGVVFYSFTFLPGRSIRSLSLSDVRGSHFRRHISEIHQLAVQVDLLDEGDG